MFDCPYSPIASLSNLGYGMNEKKEDSRFEVSDYSKGRFSLTSKTRLMQCQENIFIGSLGQLGLSGPCRVPLAFMCFDPLWPCPDAVG
jgi:hypothetical protein